MSRVSTKPFLLKWYHSAHNSQHSVVWMCADEMSGVCVGCGCAGVAGEPQEVVKAAAARVPPKEKIAQFSQWNSFTPHSASKPGLTAVDVRASSSDLVTAPHHPPTTPSHLSVNE
jgi:hypothetical protein